MRIILKSQGNIYSLMRKCGYRFERKEGEELAFSRVIGASKSGYPRFHVYLKFEKVSRETFINLHLDQKKPVYPGTLAHAAEYSGEVVEKEAERIKRLVRGL